MANKILVFDTETTGLLYYRHCIHQLSGYVVIDDQVVEEFDFKIRPHEKAEIDPVALTTCGVTIEEIQAYPHRTTQFLAFRELLRKYVDQYDPMDKFFLLGFNNAFFDNQFLRNFFILEDDNSFGVFFWQNPIDCMVLASRYLIPDRHLMPSFKLHRVAKHLGISVDDSRLHEALYDVYLTFEIYKKVRGKTIDEW